MVSPEETQPHQYNELYEQLVFQADDEFDEMVGMLAYGEYKREKNLFFARFVRKYGQRPSETDVDNFMLKYLEEDTRTDLLTDARNKLYLFADSYHESMRGEMVAKAKESEVVRVVRDNTHWGKGIGLSIVAAFAYSLIVGGVTFSITVLNPESTFSKFIKSLLQ